MEINTTSYSKSPLLNPQTLAEQKKIAGNAKPPQKNPTTTEDALTLSNSSLNLSQLANQQANNQIPPISDSAQAQNVAERVVSGIQANPAQAKQAYSNLIQVNLKPLLG